MAAKKSKRKATKKKTARKDPFDIRDKPIVYLTELERKRMDDELGGMLEEPMIQDARAGDRGLLVVAAILTLPSGEARLLHWGDEWGDGEGAKLSEHMVLLADRALQEGETVRVDQVHVLIASAGCTCTVTPGEALEHDDVDDILAPSLAADLARVRRAPDNEAVLWLLVLTTAAGAQRVVSAFADDGSGRPRATVAQIVLRARRLKWLQPGEGIQRARLDLRLSGTSTWTATVTADPVR